MAGAGSPHTQARLSPHGGAGLSLEGGHRLLVECVASRDAFGSQVGFSFGWRVHHMEKSCETTWLVSRQYTGSLAAMSESRGGPT